MPRDPMSCDPMSCDPAHLSWQLEPNGGFMSAADAFIRLLRSLPAGPDTVIDLPTAISDATKNLVQALRKGERESSDTSPTISLAITNPTPPCPASTPPQLQPIPSNFDPIPFQPIQMPPHPILFYYIPTPPHPILFRPHPILSHSTTSNPILSSSTPSHSTPSYPTPSHPPQGSLRPPNLIPSDPLCASGMRAHLVTSPARQCLATAPRQPQDHPGDLRLRRLRTLGFDTAGKNPQLMARRSGGQCTCTWTWPCTCNGHAHAHGHAHAMDMHMHMDMHMQWIHACNGHALAMDSCM